ncbi:hypothetical protein QFC21_004704 [Naganishia friedmannii]|uniref:Uncharacterized protein n=1 Tax=Naganishia friedmannii TaxID=89922 RepID=A0ACC2VGH0_9TREE|nr:hypothetical protein QFC21_004704 [Naganishia friedmannii]
MPPPTLPSSSSNAMAEAGANAAARQHHVYLHSMDHFGRGRPFRRGPSRFKWFLLGGLAAFVLLKHRRNQQLRYGDEDECDPRRYFFACRRRVEDSIPVPASSPDARNEPTHTASVNDRLNRGEMQGREWHSRWQRHQSDTPTIAMNNHSDTISESTPKTESTGKSNVKANAEPAELLTFDNTSFDRQPARTEPTSRERMESEAMAFAEEKIDALVNLLEGLKTVSSAFRTEKHIADIGTDQLAAQRALLAFQKLNAKKE